MRQIMLTLSRAPVEYINMLVDVPFVACIINSVYSLASY